VGYHGYHAHDKTEDDMTTYLQSTDSEETRLRNELIKIEDERALHYRVRYDTPADTALHEAEIARLDALALALRQQIHKIIRGGQ
jgi:hypothetical protein